MSTPRVFPPCGQGIASQYEVLPVNLKSWKKQFLENMSLAFDKSTVVKEYKDEIEELKKSKDSIAKKLGETIVGKDFFVEKLNSLVPSKERKFLSMNKCNHIKYNNNIDYLLRKIFE